MSDKHDVFLSYTHDAHFIMRRVREILTNAGFTVWNDDDIRSGAEWHPAIEDAIRDADSIVIIITPSTRDSTWVAMEYVYAKTSAKCIFPLLVMGKDEKVIPDYVTHLQFVDVRNDDADFDKLIEDLRLCLSSLPIAPVSAFEIIEPPAPSPEAVSDFPLTVVKAARKIPASAKTRACLFLLDEDQDELYMAVSSEGYSEAERGLRFKRGQGVVGDVLKNSRPLAVDLARVNFQELDGILEMTAEQIRLTQHVKSVLAVPVLAQVNGSKVVGVLSIDSPLPLDKSDLSVESVINDALEIANLITGSL